MRGHFFQECMRESSSSHDERFAKTRGNRDVRGSKLRGRTRRAIIGSIIPGNDSPAEGNWSLVIPPGLLRAGNNYGFAVNRSDSRSLHSERKREREREREREKERKIDKLQIVLSHSLSLSLFLFQFASEKSEREGKHSGQAHLYRSIIYTLFSPRRNAHVEDRQEAIVSPRTAGLIVLMKNGKVVKPSQ